MPSKNVSNRPPLSDWQVELLRLTAFPSPVAQMSDSDTWWNEIAKEQPETQIIQRTGEKIYEGGYLKGRLVLSVHPLRVDWNYAVMDNPMEDAEPKNLGTFPDTARLFSALMGKWLEILPIIRIAFGAVLLQPVDSREEGYRILSSYLPVDIDPDNTTDLLYQINRRRASSSGIPSLFINRLTKWSVLLRQRNLLTLAPGSPAQHHIQSETIACRLELDINTAPEFEGELPQEKLPMLFQELVEMGTEIAEKGDIR